MVCQCHRSCRTLWWNCLRGVLPQMQFLDKVVDMPVASMTGAWGRQCRKLRHPQLQFIDQVFDVLVAQLQQIRAKSWETVEIPQL